MLIQHAFNEQIRRQKSARIEKKATCYITRSHHCSAPIFLIRNAGLRTRIPFSALGAVFPH
jgi:hypothetical protein